MYDFDDILAFVSECDDVEQINTLVLRLSERKKALQWEVRESLIQKFAEGQKALEEQIKIAAEGFGIDFVELMGKGEKVKRKLEAKYQSKINPEMTWTGRGVMPRWLFGEVQDSGEPIESFLINK